MVYETVKGFRDLDPKLSARYEKIKEIIRQVYHSHSFQTINLPAVEYLSTLSAKFGAGEDSDVLKETFKVIDQGGRNLGLRFEHTTSLGRYMSNNKSVKLPFKVSQQGVVFRNGPVKPGRYRQFEQYDADIVGSKSYLSDVECLEMVNEVLSKLGIKFNLIINSKKILDYVLGGNSENKTKAVILIDKWEKLPLKDIIKGLNDLGYDGEKIVKTLSLDFESFPDCEGKRELEKIFSSINFPYTFCPYLARGQAYYTGMIFEAFPINGKVKSSICGGGRYDGMVSEFAGRDLPTVGVSFGIDTLLDVLGPDESSVADIVIIPISTENLCIKLSSKLRELGLAVDIAIGKSLTKNLNYASSLNSKYALIVGKKNPGYFTLRDLNSGEEQDLSEKDLFKKFSP